MPDASLAEQLLGPDAERPGQPFSRHGIKLRYLTTFGLLNPSEWNAGQFGQADLIQGKPLTGLRQDGGKDDGGRLVFHAAGTDARS